MKVARLPAAHVPSTKLSKQKKTNLVVAQVCKDLDSGEVEENEKEEVIKNSYNGIVRIVFGIY